METQELKQMLFKLETRTRLGQIKPQDAYAEFQKSYVSIMKQSMNELVFRLVKALSYCWLRDSEFDDRLSSEDVIDRILVVIDGCISDDEIIYQSDSKPYLEDYSTLAAKYAVKTLQLA